MLRTRMTTLSFILSELFLLDGFRCNFVSALLLENRLEYYDDTLSLCRTGHVDVSHTKMVTLAIILFELFPLDHFICNFVSAISFEYPLEYNHDTSQLCRTGHDDMLCTRMTTHHFILFELFRLDGFRCNFVSAP